MSETRYRDRYDPDADPVGRAVLLILAMFPVSVPGKIQALETVLEILREGQKVEEELELEIMWANSSGI